VKLAFLGTGAAFSLERYNGAVVVDDHLLLDAGAPVLRHLHRLGIDPQRIDAIFLTHFHGDHGLGLPTFLLYRAFHPSGALPLVGPPGIAQWVEELCRLAWHQDWPQFRDRARITYHEAAPTGEVAGIRYESIALDHGSMECRGYRLHLNGRVLAYAGDAIISPALEQLVARADVAITEATSPHPSAVHTSWEEAQALTSRHPTTRFIFNHVAFGHPPGAAQDLEVIEV
jgi:ribonuclease Z